MKIYTKQGDKGQTSIYAKEVLKVSKDDILIECYGTLDELNSQLGLVAALINEGDKVLQTWASNINKCQQHIFLIGFALSDEDKLHNEHVKMLEEFIDEIQSTLAPQTRFILPGGSINSAQCHVARTIARRAERALVSASKAHTTNPLALSYINRLSDFLFVLARLCNVHAETPDIEV